MFEKKLGANFQKNLSKLGVCLGLAGVSATAVACYGPPANVGYVNAKETSLYESMCDGGSCEAYCKEKADNCTTYAAVPKEPCDRDKYEPMKHFVGMLLVCNENWRVEKVDCHNEYVEIDGKLACAGPKTDEAPAEAAPSAEADPSEAPELAAEAVPAAEPTN